MSKKLPIGGVLLLQSIICVAFDSLISELLVSIQSNTLVSCGIESAEANGNGIQVFSFIHLIEVGFGLQRNSPQISVLDPREDEIGNVSLPQTKEKNRKEKRNVSLLSIAFSLLIYLIKGLNLYNVQIYCPYLLLYRKWSLNLVPRSTIKTDNNCRLT